MKNLIQYVIMLFGITCSTFCLGQSSIYYLGRYGDIQDRSTYEEQKNLALNTEKTHRGKQLDFFEDLIKLYNKDDSIVYSYNWVLTDNVEKTKKDFQNRNTLIGTIYPIQDERTLKDSILNIEGLKGKPTLINLWFTSCPPCIREMPVLNEMKAKNDDRFNFLSITMDSKSKVNKFLEKNTFDFDHIVGSKKLTTKLGLMSYPLNLFLDKEGRIRIIEGSVPVKESDNGIPIRCPDKFLKVLESLL